MSGSAIHLHGEVERFTLRRMTACGMPWAEVVQGPKGGSALRFLRDAVDDPKAADCRRCLRARAARAKGST